MTPETKLEPAIQRVPLDTLRIFEISEAELEALERGSPESLFLNLALGILPIAISFTITLATTTIDDIKTFTVFVVITTVGYLAGITFAALWFIFRKSFKSVSAKIRARIPPTGIQEVVTAS